jgi:hypothetical protein
MILSTWDLSFLALGFTINEQLYDIDTPSNRGQLSSLLITITTTNHFPKHFLPTTGAEEAEVVSKREANQEEAEVEVEAGAEDTLAREELHPRRIKNPRPRTSLMRKWMLTF